MPPQQIHPGFDSMQEALGLIDLKVSKAVGRIDSYRLTARVESGTVAADVATIFPEALCRKFSGQRLRVRSRLTYRQDLPFAMLVWRGRGKIDGRATRAGQEFFVTYPSARRGIEIQNTSDDESLELFTFQPGIMKR